MKHELQLEMLPQPDGTTCGPTALHAVYRYYGDKIELSQVIAGVSPLESGGTLAVSLACHALQRGYDATIYTYNLHLFDPTWFVPGVDISARLRAQMAVKQDAKLRLASGSYLEFFTRGGRLAFEKLSADLIARHLGQQRPILTGLSATYLYACARETASDYDDVHGVPCGHFVVLSGYDADRNMVQVADPLQDNPRFGSGCYWVSVDRLVGAILLGIITYDANLLVIEPRAEG